MSSEKEREYVSGMYPTARWRQKVARMSDAQVVAIYLKEHQKPPPEPEPEHFEDDPEDIPF